MSQPIIIGIDNGREGGDFSCRVKAKRKENGALEIIEVIYFD